MPIRIIIADDHAMFRSGIHAFLEKEDDFKIVGESGDGLETIKLVSEKSVDVLLLDISMPGPPTPKVAEEILKKQPCIAIVILTMHEDEYYLQEFLKTGVRAFVLKKSTCSNLIEAINAAFNGNYYIDPAFSDYFVSNLIEHPDKKTGKISHLTKRELEVLKLLVLGYTNSQIGERLFISKRTVETHRTNIMTKLGLKSRAELVRFAIDNKLINT